LPISDQRVNSVAPFLDLHPLQTKRKKEHLHQKAGRIHKRYKPPIAEGHSGRLSYNAKLYS